MSAPREVVHREAEPGLLVFLSTELDKAAARLAGLGVFLSGELDKTAARLAGKTLAVFIAAYPKVSPDEPPAWSQVRGARAGLGAVIEALYGAARDSRPGAAAEEELARRALQWADRLREVEAEIQRALGSEGEAAS